MSIFKIAFSVALFKILVEKLKEKWPEFFRFLESYGIKPEILFLIVFILLIGLVAYAIIDVFRIRKERKEIVFKND